MGFTFTHCHHILSLSPRNQAFLIGVFLVFRNHYVAAFDLSLTTDTPFESYHLVPYSQTVSQGLPHLFLGSFVPVLIQKFAIDVVIFLLPDPPQKSPPSVPHNQNNRSDYFRLIPPPQRQVQRPEVNDKISEEAVPSAAYGILPPAQHHFVSSDIGIYQYEKVLSGWSHRFQGGVVDIKVHIVPCPGTETAYGHKVYTIGWSSSALNVA